MTVLLSLALAASVGLAGCKGGSGSRSGSVAPTTAAPTVPATTTTSTVPPTTVYRPSAPQPSQDQAGSHLVAAWKAGDRAAALTDATPAAVEAVFAQPFPAGGVQARGCSNAVAGPSSCVYRIFATGGLLELSAVAGSGGGWLISDARFVG
ncbi:MAG: hypothetical protein QOF30_221 [Acidimicrobiaceae bacterium]|jgi:hypothetical protein|nr:hypothetical protein [Acidimicrobiaceae bacterium]